MKTLKEIREENHVTAIELAEAFNVSSSTIFHVESDSSNIKNSLLKKYMKAFDVDYDDIFLGSKYDISIFLREKRKEILKNMEKV